MPKNLRKKAGAKKGRKGPKRHTSAQTKVKLSQAAKKRQRGPKGSVYGGRFMAGLSAAKGHRKVQYEGQLFDGAEGRPAKQAKARKEPSPMQLSLLNPSEGAPTGKGPPKGATQQAKPAKNPTYSKSINQPKKSSAGTGPSGSGTQGTMGKTRKMAQGAAFKDMTADEIYASVVHRKQAEFQKKGMKEKDAAYVASHLATEMAFARTGEYPDPTKHERVVHRPTRDDTAEGRIARLKMDAEMEAGTQRKANRQGTYDVNQKREQLPREVQVQLSDPSSKLRRRLDAGLSSDPNISNPYYTSHGGRERHKKFVDSMYRGQDLDTAAGEALADNRGRRRVIPASNITEDDVRASLVNKTERQGRKSRTERLSPRPGESRFGIRTPAVRTIAQIEEKFPTANRDELIGIKEVEKQAIIDDFVANQAWAHETKRAKLKGANSPEASDKVTFFTTSLGAPAVSVPSDSLMGQYVIRKRIKMLKNEKIVPGAQLKGRFPEAVRDMHIVEASTGVSFGVEGTGGLFHRTGARFGKHKTPGYGKPLPVGSTVLRDSSNQPIYDAAGNVRYTEGATRQFALGREREAGFRVFVG